MEAEDEGGVAVFVESAMLDDAPVVPSVMKTVWTRVIVVLGGGGRDEDEDEDEAT